MTTNKPKNIDEYIASFPPDVHAMLEQVRQTITLPYSFSLY